MNAKQKHLVEGKQDYIAVYARKNRKGLVSYYPSGINKLGHRA